MARHKKKPENMTPEERKIEQMKMEIAGELGIIDKVKEKGWKGLTSRETGKIGGIISRRLRREKNK
ncbi:MAG: small, acid-soluble spore protein, alpha/beta type [Bacillota bacterium]|jgi:small acid-soluble spore protein F (minor alpha/beta-type SASP)|nr:small, acid-soluble spore protein, alpha/beta type [Bacillota bacterium]HHU29109.1 small, acid-soluble spore protein, alpha/beta type [Bacillota bacterium]